MACRELAIQEPASSVPMGPLKLAQELSGKSKPIQEKFAPNGEASTEMARAAVTEKAVPLLMVGRSELASQIAPSREQTQLSWQFARARGQTAARLVDPAQMAPRTGV